MVHSTSLAKEHQNAKGIRAQGRGDRAAYNMSLPQILQQILFWLSTGLQRNDLSVSPSVSIMFGREVAPRFSSNAIRQEDELQRIPRDEAKGDNDDDPLLVNVLGVLPKLSSLESSFRLWQQ